MADGGSGSVAWHTLDPDAAVAAAGSDRVRGLTAAEASVRAGRHGPNALSAAPPPHLLVRLVRQYADPMQLVLLGTGVVSIVLVGEVPTGILLFLLTLLNAAMGLSQEGKAAAAVAALAGSMTAFARVRRDGELRSIPATELVPGDIAIVEAGDRIPADARILVSATLEVDEAALTGEGLPVAKGPDAVASVETPLGDRTSMAWMQTSVTRGSAELLVTATGMATEVGRISGMLAATGETETPLTRQLTRLTNLVILIAAGALGASVLLGLARGVPIEELFVSAVAFTVAAIPTGLPIVVTAILSAGTQALARSNAIVKRMRSVETLGATSAICSDKTGTLTLNQMTAVSMAIPGRRYAVDGSGYASDGAILRTAGAAEVPLDAFLMPMVLASDAVVRDGDLVGDPTEGALVVLAAKGGVSALETRAAYPRLATLPFDSAYKLMATFHALRDESGADVIRAFVKGAPDQLLARGTHALDPDDLHPLPVDASLRDAYLAENERLGREGLRVMATARKDFDPAGFDPAADLLGLLEGLTLLALVGIVDPPRPAAQHAIAVAQAAGIEVRMITGDHAVTAEAIARRLGIRGRAITGSEWAAMSDAQALAEVDGIGVIARVTPADKVRLVEILQRRGQVVAMTGDGVNDAPALKRADIGVAMGIAGSEVSKEAAVMILTDDDFGTIVRAVEEGRGLYDNLRKYVRNAFGTLFGLMTTFFGAAVLGVLGGIPFLPLQSLWISFTVQASQALGLGYGAPAEGLMTRRPRPPGQAILPRPVLAWLALAGVCMGLVTLLVMAWASDAYGDAIARTMGFITFSTLVVCFSWATKDEDRSLLEIDVASDRTLVRSTLISAVVTFLAVELGPLQRLLGTVSLTWEQWAIALGAGLAILVVSEVRKRIWRFGDDALPVVTPAAEPGAGAAA
ncbi:MAG: cation-translocating P-type ATPase [Chloroflexota bacterium]